MEPNLNTLKIRSKSVAKLQEFTERQLAVVTTLKYFGFVGENDDVSMETISAISTRALGLKSTRKSLTDESALALACIAQKAQEAEESGATPEQIISTVDEDLIMSLISSPSLKNYEFVGTVLKRISINAETGVGDLAELVLESVASREAEVQNSTVKVTIDSNLVAVPNEDGTTAVH